MYLSPEIEKKIVIIFCLFLIIINLIALYFIIDLLSYDELIGYVTIHEIKSRNTRPLAFLFLAGNCANLLFVSISLMLIFVSNSYVRDQKQK